MNVYRKALDRFALNTLHKLPNIPDVNLCVGVAERRDSLPLLVYEHYTMPAPIIETITTLKQASNEEIAQAIADGSLEVNDLNTNTIFIGSGLGV